MTNLLDRLFGHAAPAWHDGNPVREELFSVERLEEHVAFYNFLRVQGWIGNLSLTFEREAVGQAL